MTLKIDTPCFVSIRSAQGDRQASVTLSILGGSLWFQRSSCPASLTEGAHKGAEVEVMLRSVRVGDSVRTMFSPVRLLSVS